MWKTVWMVVALLACGRSVTGPEPTLPSTPMHVPDSLARATHAAPPPVGAFSADGQPELGFVPIRL